LPDKDSTIVKRRVALVMKGGGVKGLALVGALIELQCHYEFDAFVGTSAGAIVASLLAFGRSPSDLENILRKTDFRRFQDASLIRRWWNLLRYGYLHPGKSFEAWFWREVKAAYNDTTRMVRPPEVGDAPRHLVIFATQAGKGLVRFDSEDKQSERGRLVTFAVRASMSIPGFFKPPTLDGQPIYDGGLLANFPAKEWMSKYPDQPFLGIYLGPEVNDPTLKRSWMGDSAEIVITRDDYTFIDSHRDSVVVVDPAPISTTDFGIGKPEADFLILEGRASALEHMAHVLKDQDLRTLATARRTQADVAKKLVLRRINSRASLRRWSIVGVAIVAVALLFVLFPHGSGKFRTECEFPVNWKDAPWLTSTSPNSVCLNMEPGHIVSAQFVGTPMVTSPERTLPRNSEIGIRVTLDPELQSRREQEQKDSCLGAGELEYAGNLNPVGDRCERRGPNADTWVSFSPIFRYRVPNDGRVQLQAELTVCRAIVNGMRVSAACTLQAGAKFTIKDEGRH
jgi:predicted acylesterase/phospholipase RssA